MLGCIFALPLFRNINTIQMSGPAALQTTQVVLGDDMPEWESSNTMPLPSGDFSRYRGRLDVETANFIKRSRYSPRPSPLSTLAVNVSNLLDCKTNSARLLRHPVNDITGKDTAVDHHF